MDNLYSVSGVTQNATEAEESFRKMPEKVNPYIKERQRLTLAIWKGSSPHFSDSSQERSDQNKRYIKKGKQMQIRSI